MKEYSPYQFAIFRIVFGLYLALHFAALIPYAPEIFSSQGTFPEPELNFTYKLFPNLLNCIDAPAGTVLFVSALTFLAVLFAAGFQRRAAAILLWYGFACLYNRNNLTGNPSFGYVGWLLLACVFIPGGEPWSLDRRFRKTEKAWRMPPLIYTGAWVILAVGYFLSGIAKLKSPSWVDGTAIRHLIENPLARDYFLRDFFLLLPPWLIKLKTWGALGIELLFLPLCVTRTGRFAAWVLSIAMHLGILSIVAFADLTMGMLVFHLFLLDPAWFPARKRSGEYPVVLFDGVCNLCDATVSFLVAEDRDRALRYGTLQGEAAKKYLPGRERMSTIVYLDEKGEHAESSAIARILSRIGGVWRPVSWLLAAVPTPLRNIGYRFVSRNRYRWFGKKDTCRLPTPEERSLFLD